MPEHPAADLVIRGGTVVSVFTGEVFPADISIEGVTISGVLPPGTPVDAAETLDARGLTIAPGYVDAHMHVESTFVTPAAFGWLTLPCGTTTVLADSHEIVNVAGKIGLRWMIESGQNSPQTILFGVPSCVPALLGFETAGAVIDADDVAEMLEWPGVIGLGEVMDYRAVVRGDSRMLDIIAAARDRGRLIDGHCPNLAGVELSRYMATGVDSDHTKNPVEISIEKARMGMLVMLQEKCIRPEMIDALLALPIMPPICLVTDDVAPDAIVQRGHLDHVARMAVEAGLPPLVALRAMTWNPAQRLRHYDRGVVSPGKRADLVLLDDLATFAPRIVLAGGRVVARDGQAVYAEPSHPAAFATSIKLESCSSDDFRWRLDAPAGDHMFRAIRSNVIDTSTLSDAIALPVVNGEVRWEGRTTLLTIWERYGQTSARAFAPVLGFDLSEGAVATSYAHDSHNLLVLGTSQRAMAAAANAVIAAQGGIAVAHGECVVAMLPLPVAGLMSDRPLSEVVDAATGVRSALESWGYRHANAFMSISTLGLPVSPQLKLTDQGLVDVVQRAWAGALVSST